ncbi:hypothetical protein BAUCODRAFT_157025 [Baudoinia panamericana UAMH 10762]|uniref:Mitochondrial carrier protein n=1 Tax=Baudoinia panamericana (strain UAMH 10762) TaxID=717646 RepID=M2MG50_BAUPA|nr:uncharacterized protein BAUCODRAFT_157025 [Baudoinia panamericana UAMH 10762]EMC95601.1 hypothetical protein BAUCODRAFT_157025 [Baudoinia panamericana UAMH 10762]
MAADFWAGYSAGVVGIVVGNPLDILKTRLQAGTWRTEPSSSTLPDVSANTRNNATSQRWTSLLRGAAAPILGYGLLNALLFVSYNRSLALLNTGSMSDWPENPSAWSIWTAGALGGLATFIVSAPTELVKCRAQVSNPPQSSLDIARQMWKQAGLRGLYLGGGITSVRDAVGYGFYFWSYEMTKRAMTAESDSHNQQALKVLLCGGLAGIVTWSSIFPLDVIKTRYQTWDLVPTHSSMVASPAAQPLLRQTLPFTARPSTLHIAKEAYAAEGISVFSRGLGVCSARAFVVNAVQWAVYEYVMKQLTH